MIDYLHTVFDAEQTRRLFLDFKSIAVGVFSADGTLKFANRAMSYYLNCDENLMNASNAFVNPALEKLMEIEGEGLIFQGLLTIGNRQDINFVLEAKITRKSGITIVIAEADVFHLFEENSKMSKLNQEVNNLQRQLIGEKKRLQEVLNELRQTQDMLIHSEKMNAMGKLVAGVAHELNNPIAFVYSNLFSLESYMNDILSANDRIIEIVNTDDSGEMKGLVEKVREEKEWDFMVEDLSDLIRESKIGLERVRKIVDDLRRFSRLDESDIKTVDLMESIQSTLSIANVEIKQKNIHFVLHAPQKLNIECYPGQLNQALLNILINAIQAVEKEGNVTMTVKEDDKGEVVTISVKDNGEGIPENIRGKIFDPFFTTRPVGQGTGLGLSIVYKIIHDLHKGSIRVISEPHEGAEFIISIPKKVLK